MRLPCANGALKRRLEQALLVRGSRDFESVEAWQAFVDEVVRKANAGRGARVAEEIAVMRVLDVGRLQEFREEDARVSEWSTIRVKECASALARIDPPLLLRSDPDSDHSQRC